MHAVNVGSEESVSIAELANRINLKRVGQDAVHCKYSDSFGNGFLPVLDRQPNTDLLQKSTNWRPSFSLTEIITDCIDYADAIIDSRSEDERTA